MEPSNTLWEQLLTRQEERVRTVLNLLLEAPYFYKEDDELHFNFLRRHRREFRQFFERFFGWTLVMDGKCARIYKEKWYNRGVTESQRDLFNFTRRDECIAFMLILEFFEHQLDENSMTVEDRDYLRFTFGGLLEFCGRRFRELFRGQEEKYTDEYLRSRVLRRVMPVLDRYRFLRKIQPDKDDNIREEQTIYEALPAMYHYNSGYLNKHIGEIRNIIRAGVESGETEQGPNEEPDDE
jgi:hypothetical protein